MRKLGKWCFTHRLITVLAWVGTLVALTAIHSAAGSAYSDNFTLSGTQSFDAVNLLQRAAPKASGDPDQIVIAVDHGKVTDPAVARRSSRCSTKVAQLPHVAAVASPYGPAGAAQISPSGQVAFANVQFDVQANKITAAAAKQFVNTARAGAGQRRPGRGRGPGRAGRQPDGTGGPVSASSPPAVVLFLVFGSLLAVALPLMTAALRARHRGRGDRPAVARDQMASFSSELSAADRPRGRRRLRAVHRHALPAGAAARADAARRRWSRRSTPPAGRCCSPA